MSNDNNGSDDKFFETIRAKVKGDDPDDYQNKILKLCQTFLASYWLTLGLQDIEITRLTGGMQNQIYRCKALTTNGVEDNETPDEVVIRFYGHKYDAKTCPKDSRFYDGVIAWIASEEGFGPKVYGLFEGGQVLKYYQHRLMEEKDFYDQAKLERVAQIMATFHGLKPPMDREKRKEFYLSLAFDICDEGFYDNFMAENKSLLEKTDCKALLELDLKTEVLWLKEIIKRYESPLVFTHDDFRIGNIMVTDSNGIVLTDFDYSVYGHRGFDFAYLFLAFENRVDNRFEFKDESIVRQFITSYVKQCERMYGKHYSDNPLNSVQHILEECKQFLIFTSLYLLAMGIRYGHELPFTIEEQLLSNNHTARQYQAIKSMLIKDNLVE